MKAMESPLSCLTNQPSNSSHTSNTQAAEFHSDVPEVASESATYDVIREDSGAETTTAGAASPQQPAGECTQNSIIKPESADENNRSDHEADIAVGTPEGGVTEATKRAISPSKEQALDLSGSLSGREEAGENLREQALVLAQSIKQESQISNDTVNTDFLSPGEVKQEGEESSHVKEEQCETAVSEGSETPGKQRYREIIPRPPVVSQRSRDSVEKKHKCQFCEKSFACGYSLTRHVRIHTGEQCYKCDVCDKIFTTRSSKIRHDRTHISEGTYKCEFCNKIFRRPILLTEHQVEHTGQKPFACGLCGKAFTKRFQLASHLKTHNAVIKTIGKEAVIELCELCGQGFPDKETLIEHLKEHVAEKALQSNLVDSSNDPDSTVPLVDPPVTPFGDASQFASSPGVEELKEENCENSAYYGATIVADKNIVDAQLGLESNVIYVVGEDGVLQPQVNYDLVTQQFESQESTGFVETPMDTESATAPESEKINPDLDTPMDSAESPSVAAIAIDAGNDPRSDEVTARSEAPLVASDSPLVVSDSPLVVSDSPLVASESPVVASGSPVAVSGSQLVPADSPLVASSSPLVAEPHQTATSLVIAQADTTSLDSLKTDDEDENLSPSLIEGEDILAIACKEILIAPIPESANTESSEPATSPPVHNTNSSSTTTTAATMHTPDKKFHCEYCDKSFTQRNNLDSHTRTHTKEKPFKCFHCDMAFSQRWSLTRHIRIHTGEKPFKCSFCAEAFRVKGEKTEHEKAKHMNERNERIAQQARLKIQGNVSDGNNRCAGDAVSVEMIEITPQKDAMQGHDFNTNNSNFPESSAQSMSQTDDSDSKSDYESIQSSQYGDNDTKFAIENNQENVSNHVTGLANENEIKFHYGSEEYMDTLLPSNGPILTTLTPAEFIMEDRSFNHHCDFCELSFATRTELVQHFSAHTG